MKGIIVFFSIFILALTIVVYDTDMGAYMQKQEKIKALAEDAAAGAAMYFLEEDYGKGIFKFNRQEGQKFIDFILTNKFPGEKMSYEILFDEDEKAPSVTVSIKVEGKDMFRLPFIKVNSIERKGKYELPI